MLRFDYICNDLHDFEIYNDDLVVSFDVFYLKIGKFEWNFINR